MYISTNVYVYIFLNQRSSRLCLHLSSKLYNSGGKVEEMEHLQKNPHYAKYADKIAKLQK